MTRRIRTINILLFFLFTHSPICKTIPSKGFLDDPHNQIKKEFKEGFRNASKFFRENRLTKLSTLLSNNPDFEDIIVSTDSISQFLNYPRTYRYHAIRCLANIALFAQYRNLNQAIAKNSLFDAADILFKRLNRPEDTRLLYKLGKESGIQGIEKYLEIVEKYLINDKPFEKILNINWYTFDKKEKLEYAKKLKRYLKENPNTLLKPRIENNLGDVYYSLYQFRSMKKWYEQAIISDPFLKRNSPAGYRITWGKRRINYQNIISGSYIFIFIIYLTTIIIILPTIIKNLYTFNYQIFI